MAICCCYEKYDGSDYGCGTVAGSTCPQIEGYRLVSSSPRPCADIDTIILDTEKKQKRIKLFGQQRAEIHFPSGKRVVLNITESDNNEIGIAHTIESELASKTITCTCSSTGESTKKECPTSNATCDCSDPNNPKITCN